MAWHSLFLGMKGADEVIVQDANYGSGTQEIVQQASVDHVMNDFLTQQETQRMKKEGTNITGLLKNQANIKLRLKGYLIKKGMI